MTTLRVAAVAAAVCLVPIPCSAVVVSAKDSAALVNNAVADLRLNYVGLRGSGSAVYLGDGWVLTANHVGVGAFELDGVSYQPVANSGVRLKNPSGSSLTPYNDLLMFQIVGQPKLSPLPITTAAPKAGDWLLMGGVGRARNDVQTQWTSAWTETSSVGANSGFKWLSSRALQWGTNVVQGASLTITVQGATERAFSSSFDALGTPFEASASSGDSGGAVFVYNTNSGRWELGGIMHSITQMSGQPWASSVFGNVTYAGDLSFYRDQIRAIAPPTGDLNFDGVVDIMDVAAVSGGWGTFGPRGDANYDSLVDIFDVAIIGNRWSPNRATSAVNGVPEPATMGLIAAAALVWGLYRRRIAVSRDDVVRV